jgi:hypothetical protein
MTPRLADGTTARELLDDEGGGGLGRLGFGLVRTWLVGGADALTGRVDSAGELPALAETGVLAGAGALDAPHPAAALMRPTAATTAAAERTAAACRSRRIVGRDCPGCRPGRGS